MQQQIRKICRKSYSGKVKVANAANLFDHDQVCRQLLQKIKKGSVCVCVRVRAADLD